MLIHYLGLDDGENPFYLFYSGVGAFVLSAATLIPGLWVFYRHHQCHSPRCWRIGRKSRDGLLYCYEHRESRHG